MMSKTLLTSLAAPPPPPAATVTAPNLESALSTAERLLKLRGKDMEKLYAFPTTIPALLSKQVSSHDAGECDVLRKPVAQAGLDRRERIDKLQSQQDELNAARVQVDAARLAVAPGIVGEFNERYRVALESFQRLLAEGSALGQCLRTTDIKMELTVRLERGGQPDDVSRRGTYWTPDGAGIDRAGRLLPDTGLATAPPLPAVVSRLSVALDQLDSAIAFCSTIAAHHRRVSELSFAKSEHGVFDPQGIFVVRREFAESLTSYKFQPGVYVSSAIVPPPMLLRVHKVKTISQVMG